MEEGAASRAAGRRDAAPPDPGLELSNRSRRYSVMYMYVTLPECMPVDMAVVPNPPQVPPKPINPGDPPPLDLPPARPGDVPPIDPDKPTPPKPR